MKIIKRGMLPEDRYYQGLCNHCTTVVEFKFSEAEPIYDQRDGNSLKVDCPVCERPIYVNMNCSLPRMQSL